VFQSSSKVHLPPKKKWDGFLPKPKKSSKTAHPPFKKQGSLILPTPQTSQGEIPQNCQARCVLFDSPKKNWYTPPKINIEPENDSLEDVFPFPGV